MSGTPGCAVPEFQRAGGNLGTSAFPSIHPQIVINLNATAFFGSDISVNNRWIL